MSQSPIALACALAAFFVVSSFAWRRHWKLRIFRVLLRYLRSFSDLDTEGTDGDLMWCPDCQAMKPWKHEESPDGHAVTLLKIVSGTMEHWSLCVLRAAAWIKRRGTQK